MKTTMRVSSRHDEHTADEYVWPESLPPVLPRVGDDIETGRFGLRTVVKRHFTYKHSVTGSDVTDLIVDVICE